MRMDGAERRGSPDEPPAHHRAPALGPHLRNPAPFGVAGRRFRHRTDVRCRRGRRNRRGRLVRRNPVLPRPPARGSGRERRLDDRHHATDHGGGRHGDRGHRAGPDPGDRRRRDDEPEQLRHLRHPRPHAQPRLDPVDVVRRALDRRDALVDVVVNGLPTGRRSGRAHPDRRRRAGDRDHRQHRQDARGPGRHLDAVETQQQCVVCDRDAAHRRGGAAAQHVRTIDGVGAVRVLGFRILLGRGMVGVDAVVRGFPAALRRAGRSVGRPAGSHGDTAGDDRGLLRGGSVVSAARSGCGPTRSRRRQGEGRRSFRLDARFALRRHIGARAHPSTARSAPVHDPHHAHPVRRDLRHPHRAPRFHLAVAHLGRPVHEHHGKQRVGLRRPRIHHAGAGRGARPG